MTKFLGIVLDNTAANMLACRNLEDEYPTSICFGCTPHALNLLIKVGNRVWGDVQGLTCRVG
jgi:hypothetical protein